MNSYIPYYIFKTFLIVKSKNTERTKKKSYSINFNGKVNSPQVGAEC